MGLNPTVLARTASTQKEVKMKNFLFALILVSIPVAAHAQTPQGVYGQTPVLAKGEHDSGKRVAPIQDETKQYVTFFVPSKDHELVRWAQTNERLKATLKGFHFKVMTQDDPMVSRYQITTYPAVTVQEPSGIVLYKASGQNLPNNPTALASYIEKCCPWRHPAPEPEPEPDPQPDDVPDTDPIPDTDPTPDSLSLLAALIALLGGAAAGAGIEYYKQYYKS